VHAALAARMLHHLVENCMTRSLVTDSATSCFSEEDPFSQPSTV
jgi:hypothetical protein